MPAEDERQLAQCWLSFEQVCVSRFVAFQQTLAQASKLRPALCSGLPAVAPLMGPLAEAVTRSLAAVVTAASQQQLALATMLGAPPKPGQLPKGPPRGLTPEQAAEGTAAAALLTLIVQLSEQAAAAAVAASGQPAELQLPAELQPAAKAAAAAAAADFGGGAVRLPSQGVALVEACLEVGPTTVEWDTGKCSGDRPGPRRSRAG